MPADSFLFRPRHMRAREGGWEARNVVPPYPPPARRDSGCRSPACASGGRLGTGQLPERQPDRAGELLRERRDEQLPAQQREREHRRLCDQDELRPRRERPAEDRPQPADLPRQPGRHHGLPDGLLRRGRLPPDLGGRGDRGGRQQRLHLQPDERHHRGARLRQLGRDVHDPRLLPARRRASMSRSSGRPTRARTTGSSSSFATTTGCRRPRPSS